MGERRFALGFREASLDDPGLVLGDDGLARIVLPGGDRAVLTSQTDLDAFGFADLADVSPAPFLPGLSNYTPQHWDVGWGTSTSPVTGVGPSIRIARYEDMRVDPTGITGPKNQADNEGNAALVIVSEGKSTTEVQTNPLWLYARSDSSLADVCAINGVGDKTGGTGRTGIGGYLEGKRQVDTAQANGLEVRSNNYTSTNDAYTPGSTSFPKTTGLWITAGGLGTGRVSAAGIAFGGLNGAQFDAGIAFTKFGNSSTIKSYSIIDDADAPTSIRISGTHSTAAIRIDSGAGVVIIGGTALQNASALLEVQGPNATAQPLVYFGNTSRTQPYTVRIGNAVGSGELFVAAGANNFLTGSVAGDTGYTIDSTGKRFLVGGTSIVLSASRANELGFFGAAGATKRTGWSPWTGNATRTAFSTSSATLQNVAEALKALIDDLHVTAGYGLLAA